jgi:hypothetical protein
MSGTTHCLIGIAWGITVRLLNASPDKGHGSELFLESNSSLKKKEIEK